MVEHTPEPWWTAISVVDAIQIYFKLNSSFSFLGTYAFYQVVSDGVSYHFEHLTVPLRVKDLKKNWIYKIRDNIATGHLQMTRNK